MIDEITGGNGLIAAERRRRVYELALRNGSVNVSDLADLLGVAAATIRRDLNVLDSEGKLVRSHGGAMVRPGLVTRPEYADTRDSYMMEKAAIGVRCKSYSIATTRNALMPMPSSMSSGT